MASETRKPEWEKAYRYARLLTELVDRHGLTELVLEEGGVKVKVTARRDAPQVQPSVPSLPAQLYPDQGAFSSLGSAGQQVKAVVAPDEAKTIRAPMSGTFYRSPSSGTAAFVEGGTHVDPGKVMCIIEAMKLMNEIKAEKSGTIARILVENGKQVKTGDPLFILG